MFFRASRTIPLAERYPLRVTSKSATVAVRLFDEDLLLQHRAVAALNAERVEIQALRPGPKLSEDLLLILPSARDVRFATAAWNSSSSSAAVSA